MSKQNHSPTEENQSDFERSKDSTVDFKGVVPNIVSFESLSFTELGIGSDHDRFRDIVKGKVKKQFKDLISSHDIVTQRGNKKTRIRFDQLEIPRFKHGSKNKNQGVGQGDAESGPVQKGDQPGDDEAGTEAGEHDIEAELTPTELAKMLGEELELPRIEEKGNSSIEDDAVKYNTISKRGPDSLRHKKRTFLKALKRNIVEGKYDAEKPQVIPERSDFVYRAHLVEPKPKTNAAIIYIMDISYSMQRGQKELAQMISFWIDTWLDYQYKGCEKAYIVHDAEAQEVDGDTFFRMSAGGGTKISSALDESREIIRRRFPLDEWNVYVFQFSDGDNYGVDNQICVDLLEHSIMPAVNMYGYVQVGSNGGDFKNFIDDNFDTHKRVVSTECYEADDISDTLKELLGKGN